MAPHQRFRPTDGVDLTNRYEKPSAFGLAKGRQRSVSSMVEKILTTYLRDKGYLPKGAAE
ncbi:hypothetical protein [Mesorhizobium kowhaii]|uniref:Uncharacterized protein n=1 Tax=Mesorhizobium kowhaii TaxID=1300272 RepID=A0A2W7C995_9HYPH|nr:hypothetical protein [Mesorhizobium kowhaii]PZV39752.1 hypothetical protein B5V02_07440 [Mesorhizobium kowhaii]